MKRTDPPALVAPAEAPAPLAELARRINHAHRECEAAQVLAVEKAASAGKLLLEAKKRVGHGGWLDWLKANVGFTPRTAQRYMRIAAGPKEGKSDSVSHLPVPEALAVLAEAEADGRGAAYDLLARAIEQNPWLANRCASALAWVLQEEAPGGAVHGFIFTTCPPAMLTAGKPSFELWKEASDFVTEVHFACGELPDGEVSPKDPGAIRARLESYCLALQRWAARGPNRAWAGHGEPTP